MFNRIVVKPLLELGYLIAALPLAVLGFTTAVVGLTLSIGLLPLFLIGVPLIAATAYAVHGFSLLECGLANALLDEELQARHAPRATGRGWLSRPLSYLRSPEFWKETAHALIALPLSAAAFGIVVTLWSCAFAGLLLPVYAGWLAGGNAVSWLHWDSRLETAAGVAAGLMLLVVAHLVSGFLTEARVALARSLLTPSESDQLRARVSTLQESRARVVDAADAERRRIERDLHDGAQQHLVAIAMNLGRAKTKMDTDPEGAKELVNEAHDAAKDSITALRNVVRGVHPPVLVDRGLDAALSALAARSPVPVSLDVAVADRPNATAEAVAYFVVSEALTNVAKHSGATRATVHVLRDGDRLLVSVSDNGRGGADAAPGSGLTGLRDRVEAVDGTLSLQSPPSGGTTSRRGGAMRIVIAEDSVLLRQGLVRLLADFDLEVVAAVDDADELLRVVDEHRPDLCIVDIRMPPTHTDEGVRAALVIRAQHPEVAVLMLSQYVEERYATDLIASDTRGFGYLLKDRVADVAEFVDAVRRVAAGGTALDPEVVSQLLVRSRRAEPLARLTPRETDVMRLMAEGRSNAGIATELVVSEGAVEKHVTSIFTKLGLPAAEQENRRVLAVLRWLDGV